MNPSPMLHKKEIHLQPNCGFEAMRNHATAFWQSRLTLAGRRAEPPALVNLERLAREVRRTQ